MPPPRNDNETTSPLSTTGPPSPRPRRNDNETTTACPICGNPFTPIRRQRYCTPACRQAAWRARHHHPNPEPVVTLPPRAPRHAITVYHCPECDTRTLGQQWCHDCHRPRTRLDVGGLCPHCDEPITIQDITDQHPTTTTSP
jgi:hypothetical protein